MSDENMSVSVNYYQYCNRISICAEEKMLL